MEKPTTPQTIKMTFSIPVELAQALSEERQRLAAELRTRLTTNQVATRVFGLGIDASRNA